jgi:hypothetical protein
LNEHGLGHHGTGAAGTGEPGDGRQQMQTQHGQIAHRPILPRAATRACILTNFGIRHAQAEKEALAGVCVSGVVGLRLIPRRIRGFSAFALCPPLLPFAALWCTEKARKGQRPDFCFSTGRAGFEQGHLELTRD